MKNSYNCSKCPGYCCSYEHIEVSQHDIKRLAKHLEITPEIAEKRYTKVDDGKVVLRHHKDEHYTSMCVFFDREARRCTVYEARPHPCRTYPYGTQCGYYDFLKFEREHQGDDDYVAVTR